jgi:NAD(P)-dependent dehydrogenase (short-subunit alcohol dehydrogenase family)
VDAVTIALSKELGPKKIRVNSLNPGMVGAVEMLVKKLGQFASNEAFLQRIGGAVTR